MDDIKYNMSCVYAIDYDLTSIDTIDGVVLQEYDTVNVELSQIDNYMCGDLIMIDNINKL